MQVLNRPLHWLFFVLFPVSLSDCSEPLPEGCTPLGNPERTDGISKIEIHNPGQYCLTEDLHARVEFADHPAEMDLIVIRSSNVVLDLQGHTLGRGWLFKNPGGVGIAIASEKYSDIYIKNGVLQNFDFGIYRYDFPTTDETPSYDAKANTYHFAINNIVLENLTFKNNRKNFQIRMPRRPKP